MKNETMEAKLNAMLAKLNPHKAEALVETKIKTEQRNGNIVGVTEDEIQDFRAAQGLVYFLQAPELFQAKVCKHCGAGYLVSRLYVAFCSYTCIRISLEEQGFSWRKGQDIEALIPDVYEGNEPIWVRNLPTLRIALEKLTSVGSPSSPVDTSLPVKSTSSETTGSLKRL